ncbi:MAG: NAD-dependent epimerase/dehydratase family protein [Halobacteriales archaeon]
MTIETVAVTGGNGWIGGRIIEGLNEHGYATVDLARGKRREEVSDRYVQIDLLDAGEVYGSLAEADPDALIHMGTIPAPGGNPGYRVYESNVMSTFHLLEAAGALDVDRVVLPSSINVLGAAFQDAPTEMYYLPVDEDHPRTPRDPYAVSKHAIEVTADGFGRKPEGPDSIASLRYPWVADDDALRKLLLEQSRIAGADLPRPTGHRDELFSYVHIEDAVTAARNAIEVDLGGHETFWAVAADTTMEIETAELLDPFYPDAEVRREFEGHGGLVDISKAEELLGWTPEHTWRDL